MRTYSRPTWSAALIAAAVLAVSSTSARADFPCDTDTLPSPCAAYISEKDFVTTFFGGMIQIRTINHGDFAGMAPGTTPPTAVGITQDEVFDSTLSFELSTDFGANFGDVTVASVPTHTRIELLSIDGPTRTYDAELISLDIDLGGGKMMREDPTRTSGGTTTITDIGGGMYEIDSFFDVFIELTLDGGTSWHGPDNGEHHLQAVPVPGSVMLGALGMGFVGWVRRRTS